MLDQNTSCVFTNVTNNMNDTSTNTSHNIMIQAKVILTMHLELIIIRMLVVLTIPIMLTLPNIVNKETLNTERPGGLRGALEYIYE